MQQLARKGSLNITLSNTCSDWYPIMDVMRAFTGMDNNAFSSVYIYLTSLCASLANYCMGLVFLTPL